MCSVFVCSWTLAIHQGQFTSCWTLQKYRLKCVNYYIYQERHRNAAWTQVPGSKGGWCGSCSPLWWLNSFCCVSEAAPAFDGFYCPTPAHLDLKGECAGCSSRYSVVSLNLLLRARNVVPGMSPWCGWCPVSWKQQWVWVESSCWIVSGVEVLGDCN